MCVYKVFFYLHYCIFLKYQCVILNFQCVFLKYFVSCCLKEFSLKKNFNVYHYSKNSDGQQFHRLCFWSFSKLAIVNFIILIIPLFSISFLYCQFSLHTIWHLLTPSDCPSNFSWFLKKNGGVIVLFVHIYQNIVLCYLQWTASWKHAIVHEKLL